MDQIEQIAPCPKCSATQAEKVGYTWWGGALGPRMLNHVKCTQCGTRYNSKTGTSNVGKIIVYNVVALIIVIVIIAALNGI